MFPVDGGKAAFGPFRFAPDGKGAYYTSDEGTEFRTLRYHAPGMAEPVMLSENIPWDVTGYDIADDGKHLVFATNEDGIGKLHLRTLPDHREVALPELPVGVIGGIAFSPDGTRIALTTSPRSPSRAGRRAKWVVSTPRASSRPA
jgi:Tol biopolymer transport system component